MREIQVPQSKAKLRLLNAAEGLFAEKGFDAVSVRDVTQAAKANVAAVNYHFGSRDGMISIVIARYMTPIHEERVIRLDALEKKRGGVPLEEILDAFVRPVVNAVHQSELSEAQFCKLVGRIFALNGQAFPELVESQHKETLQRFMKLLGKVLPKVDKEELFWRMHFVIGALIHTLSHQDMMERISGGASGAPSMEVMLGRFERFAAAGLREGMEPVGGSREKKGPQATFDF